jgi:porphobilinogen synthase
MKYIACVFLKEGAVEKEKSPMEGVDYHTLNSALEYTEGLIDKGITDFLVFGSTDNKSVDFACSKGLIKEFIKVAKEKFGNKIIIHADAGLSPYLDDGHSLIVIDGEVNMQGSYAEAAKLAVAFAKVGADYICPCLPIENQVREIRKSLDDAGLKDTKIMGYSAKFASALYGPYFKTVQSSRDGKTPYQYHISPLHDEEALKHITDDERQGANIVMVKPAMMYMDIIYRAKQITKLPLSVYHVSGEYTMIKEACKTGMLDENEVFDEIHSAFKRSGADYVIGYAPEHFLRWTKNH